MRSYPQLPAARFSSALRELIAAMIVVDPASRLDSSQVHAAALQQLAQ